MNLLSSLATHELLHLHQHQSRTIRILLYYSYSLCINTLWKWNVIMYANVTLPLALVSNKLNVPFFSVLFQWEKFRRALWELVSKKRAKIQEKDAWLLCGRVSASLNAKSLPDFSFPNSRSHLCVYVCLLVVEFGSMICRQYRND